MKIFEIAEARFQSMTSETRMAVGLALALAVTLFTYAIYGSYFSVWLFEQWARFAKDTDTTFERIAMAFIGCMYAAEIAVGVIYVRCLKTNSAYLGNTDANVLCEAIVLAVASITTFLSVCVALTVLLAHGGAFIDGDGVFHQSPTPGVIGFTMTLGFMASAVVLIITAAIAKDMRANALRTLGVLGFFAGSIFVFCGYSALTSAMLGGLWLFYKVIRTIGKTAYSHPVVHDHLMA